MTRKRKHSESVSHERWLVSYADFITLLFAFFVVMFAAGNSDNKKAGQVAKAVQVAFRELAVFNPSGKVVPIYDSGGLPEDTKTVIGNTNAAFDATQLVSGVKSMSEARIQLESMLQEQLKNQSVRISEDARGLIVSLTEAGFFDAGSAVMPPRALAVIDKIAATLAALPNGIRVEGHTDNTPIHTAQFPSNWELSTTRATFLLQYLISNANISPPRLSAVGYGEYRPTASNDTAEGRASNRRVDIVILGDAAQRLEPELK